MTPAVRQATRADIPGMHRIRMVVRENRLTSTILTEEHYVPAIEDTGRGWVAEDKGSVIGFAIGNVVTGNIWALFVDPEYEGRGHGRRLHDEMVGWLFSQGVRRLWLGTAPNTRAQRFYEAAGWSFLSMLAEGQALYELHAPPADVHPGRASLIESP
jgi:ribosomal protein S18 acetylase RimI-like enzyme